MLVVKYYNTIYLNRFKRVNLTTREYRHGFERLRLVRPYRRRRALVVILDRARIQLYKPHLTNNRIQRCTLHRYNGYFIGTRQPSFAQKSLFSRRVVYTGIKLMHTLAWYTYGIRHGFNALCTFSPHVRRAIHRRLLHVALCIRAIETQPNTWTVETRSENRDDGNLNTYRSNMKICIFFAQAKQVDIINPTFFKNKERLDRDIVAECVFRRHYTTRKQNELRNSYRLYSGVETPIENAQYLCVGSRNLNTAF